MAVNICNDIADYDTINEASIIGRYTAHDVLVFIAILSTSIALVLSFGQIIFHATHYHIPEQQRRINRLLFMIPVYAVSNLLAAIYYQNSIYFELVGNAYAAIGLASFFNLLYAYVTEGAQDPKQYFRRIKLKRWQWPLSWLRVKTPSQGLTWFNICYCGVFQYNFVLLANCIAGSLANVFNRYCPASLGPQHAYIWILVTNAISATVSSYCLTQFHRQVRHDLDKHRADFQFICIQIVLYLSTYQKLLITLLLRRNWIHTSIRIQALDIRIALPATLLCVEMVLVSLLHLYAYPLRPYRVWRRPRALRNYVVGTTNTYTGLGLAVIALTEMLNPWDLVAGIARAFKYLAYDIRRRHHDIGYANQHVDQITEARSTWERRASQFPPAVDSSPFPSSVPPQMTRPLSSDSEAGGVMSEKQYTYPYQNDNRNSRRKTRTRRSTIVSASGQRPVPTPTSMPMNTTTFLSDGGSIVQTPTQMRSSHPTASSRSESILQIPPKAFMK